VFEDYAGDRLQIFSMNIDGSDLQQLTHFENEDCYEPAWSPDGKNVAFISSKGGTSLGGVLWIMKADGSESRMIRPNENGFGINANFPSWSPDGRKIAFQKCYGCPAGVNYEIYVYDFESENIIKLTDENGYDTRPDWSPDGRRILFSSGRDYINADSARYRSDFYSINIDGSGLKRQSRHGNVSKPVWSPDGKIVVFDWYSDNRFDVYTQNLNDLTKSKISNPDLRDVHNPIWSTNNLNLVVFGKTWDSNDQIIRFYKIDENGTTVIQTIILEGITSGNNYDWIETQ
jgi:TolB protein